MTGAPRVLVLEDNLVMLTAMSEALEDQGYEVVGVESSGAAVELARRQSFDLVVTDIRMEGIDGLQALEQMQELQPRIHSMVVTGYSSEADSLRAIRLGAGDYMQKPFSLLDFTQRVGKLLARPAPTTPAHQCAQAGWSLALQLLAQQGRTAELERLKVAGQLGSCLAGQQGMDEQAWSLAAMSVVARRSGLLDLPPLPAAVEQTVLTSLESGSYAAEPASGTGLLRLAHALEAVGEVEAATTALQEVLQMPEEEPQHALAGLALARLLQMRGQPQEARTQALQALTRLQALTSRQALRAMLEAGLLLQSLGEEARSWLARAAAGLIQWGDLAGAAQAHLALGQHQETALQLLLQPQNAGELAPTALWLLPRLLQEPASPLVQRALGALVREGPAEVGRLLDSGKMPPAARLRLVSVLQSEGQVMQPLLQRLQADQESAVQSAAAAALQQLGPSAPPILRIYSLGAVEVYRGQERVPETAWKTQKNRFLLAYLALQRGRPVAEERLAGEFWPDSNAQAKNLTGALSVLRLCLRPSHWQGELDYLLRAPAQVGLNPAFPRWHDVDELETALLEASRQRAAALWQPAALSALRAAALYRGQYLEDCYMDWVLPIRTRLERGLTEALWATMQGAPNLPETGELLHRLLELDPGHQSAYAVQMRMFLQAGRADLALKAFDRCERWLRRELSAEPELELVELQQRARLSI
jgi:CheY-like chemotaxis protein/DNA-binding SARP family transcriptional activator